MNRPPTSLRYEMLVTFFETHKWGDWDPVKLRYHYFVTQFDTPPSGIWRPNRVQRWGGAV